MSLRAPGRDPPRPLIPEARAEAEGLLRVQGQPVLAGREPGLPGRLRRHGDREGHRAAPARGSWRRPAAWGEGSLRHSLAVIPQPHIFTHNYPPASENHSESAPCLRKSLTVMPLPQKIKHSHPPASENHSQSSPCLRKSLTVIALPQKITHTHPLPQKTAHCHPPASEN